MRKAAKIVAISILNGEQSMPDYGRYGAIGLWMVLGQWHEQTHGVIDV
jgi:hypothetical protein